MTLTFDAHPRSSLIVALDFDSLSTAVKFAKQIADLKHAYEIGDLLGEFHRGREGIKIERDNQAAAGMGVESQGHS
jgi:3-keto-L-gulonate-6-phosphate decarboxylase